MTVPRPVLGSTPALLLALALATVAGAQEPAPLDRVESLADDGRVAEARTTLAEWWDARWDGADSGARQRALWLRGTLTADAESARRDFTRLVVEHPGGPHSAAALLRLAQAADAAGRTEEAASRYERLLRQYPNSPRRLEARQWLDEHRDGPGARRIGSRSATGAGGRVAVQIGAFRSVERARTLVRSARNEGIGGLRLVRVRGTDLVRVRSGRFASRDDAADLLETIEERGFDATIVTDADRERAVQ